MPSLRFFLGQTHPCHFRLGVSDGWDHFRIEVVLHAGDNFCGNVAFVHAFVRQHRLTDDVADSEDVRHVGAQLFVDVDEATLVNFNTGFAGIQQFAVRHAADRHQHRVITLWFCRRFYLPS